jgi:hypothetical protein
MLAASASQHTYSFIYFKFIIQNIKHFIWLNYLASLRILWFLLFFNCWDAEEWNFRLWILMFLAVEFEKGLKGFLFFLFSTLWCRKRIFQNLFILRFLLLFHKSIVLSNQDLLFISIRNNFPILFPLNNSKRILLNYTNYCLMNLQKELSMHKIMYIIWLTNILHNIYYIIYEILRFKIE